jgi:hypothetical protein
MADLQKTQAQWNNFFQVMGAEVQILDAIEALWRRCKDVRSLVTVQFDEQGVFASVDLAGQAVIGGNTDDDGYIYVSYASGSGGSTQLYSDSGRTQLVASGATASGTASMLNEKNSSGFDAVTVTLGTGPGAGFVDDTDIRFEVSQDFEKLLNDVYQTTGDAAQSQSKADSKERLEARVVSALSTAHSRRVSDFEDKVMGNFGEDFLDVEDDDANEGLGIDYDYTITNGEVLIANRTGMVAAARLSMQEESVAGAQSVAQATQSIGTLNAVSTNQGHIAGEGNPAASGSVLSMLLDQHAFDGKIKLRCTQETPGATILSVENVLTKEFPQAMNGQNSAKRVAANNDARVSRRFQDGPASLDFTANYAGNGVTANVPIESGDGDDLLSSVTLTGINASDTDAGKVYCTVERTLISGVDGSSEFTLSVFANSGRTNLRGSETFTLISGATAFSITLNSNAIFAGNFHNGNAHLALVAKGDEDNDIEYDLTIPKVGDRWEIQLTIVHNSRLNRKLGQLTGGSVPATGAPTYTEGYVAYHPTLEP